MSRTSPFNPYLTWVVLSCGPSLSLSAQTGNLDEAPPPEHEEVVVAKNVMVPMRDGVRMATDVYRPARNGEAVAGKLPTLLSRTPYGKNGGEDNAKFFAQRGYAVVIQDVRGRFESEGTFYIYVNEGRDGYDAVEWAASQPWSNGDVGTFGGSYLAATQHALAVEKPPHLKAMFVRVSTSNYLEDGAGAGGAFALLHNLAYALNLASRSQEASEDPARKTALSSAVERDNLIDWLEAYPFRPNASPLELIPTYHRWFQDWVDHPSFDDYWKQNGYTFELTYDRYPDIPVYHVGGWYDIFLRGTLNNHSGLAERHQSPTRLMIGAWEHGVGPRVTGDVDFGEEAEVDIRLEQLQWFDQVLKGEDTGVLDGPPVKLFVMGGGSGVRTPEGHHAHGGEWVSVASWPAPGLTARPFYFQPDGSLSAERAPASAEPSSFTFDPANPVPTIGGKLDSGKQLSFSGPYDQKCIEGKIFGCRDDLPLSARRDVLVFQTPPLEEDLVVMGPVTVKLWVSSTAQDTDFTAKLVDVHPPTKDDQWGYHMLIADRILRARYRNRPEREELMEPGELYELEIDLLGTANRFKTGHRLRIDISSSNFPFFDVNPNTGERLGHHTRMLTAVNTVYHDAGRPSHVVLPIARQSEPTNEP